MRTIGAKFEDEQRAREALVALGGREDVVAADLAIAPLGSVDLPPEGVAYVLTGRFTDDAVPGVGTTIGRFGGEVIADRDGG